VKLDPQFSHGDEPLLPLCQGSCPSVNLEFQNGIPRGLERIRDAISEGKERSGVEENAATAQQDDPRDCPRSAYSTEDDHRFQGT